MKNEKPEHFNCRCVVIKIGLFDLPDQTPLVTGGRYPSIGELMNKEIMNYPVKITFGSN